MVASKSCFSNNSKFKAHYKLDRNADIGHIELENKQSLVCGSFSPSMILN